MMGLVPGSLHLSQFPSRSCCMTHKLLFSAFKLKLGGFYVNVLKWQLLCPTEKSQARQLSLQGTLPLLEDKKDLFGRSHSHCVTSCLLHM